MMMDIAWGGAGTTIAPAMPGFGGMGLPDGVMSSLPDDDIEGMIDGLGFFPETDDILVIKDEPGEINTPEYSTITEESNVSIVPKSATVSPAHHPILTNDTGAVVAVPDYTLSTPVTPPASTPRDVKSLNEIATKPCGMPQPPQLLSSCQSPTTVADGSVDLQTVLDQQRETILQNQKIIEAQKNELQGQIHPSRPTPVPVAPTPSPELSASYPLAHAALKKAQEKVPSDTSNNGRTKTKGTKRKSPSPSTGANSSATTEANAYQKWKLTPAGASKLRAVDSGGLIGSRMAGQKLSDDASGKFLTPGELEIRRERNRKHAKKSRLRKKSLTSTLEQSLEVLRDENIKLRKLVEEHLAKKKQAAAEAAKETKPSVDGMLEAHRVRSHQRFIQCILAGTQNNKSKKSKDAKKKATSAKATKNHPKDTKPTGKGVVVDDKTLKVLKGLSKSIAPLTCKQ